MKDDFWNFRENSALPYYLFLMLMLLVFMSSCVSDISRVKKSKSQDISRETSGDESKKTKMMASEQREMTSENIVNLIGPVGSSIRNFQEFTKKENGVLVQHPRLFVVPGEWEALTKRLNSDSLGKKAFGKLLDLANESINEPVLNSKEDAGGRILNQARLSQFVILVNAMAYCLDKNPAYLQRAKKEMHAIAALNDWNSKHFLDTSELCLAMAVGFDWLYNELSPEEINIFSGALLEKGLGPAQEVYANGFINAKPKEKKLWWTTSNSNWNQVCHTGQVAAALVLADTQPQATKEVIKAAAEYLKIPLGSYAPQGAYPEGPGYWDYGTTYQVYAGAMLESSTGNDFGLFNAEPAFANTVMYRLHTQSPSGNFYNYADVSLNWYHGISPAVAFLGSRYQHSVALAFHRDRLEEDLRLKYSELKHNRFFPFNLMWMATAREVAGDTDAAPLDAHFSGDSDIAIFRSKWGDRNAMYVGFKAGKNGVSHGHLDQGSFILDADGVRWSSELGNDYYELPDYFGSQRNNYFRCNNRGHSTLLLNNELQGGKSATKIVSFHSTENESMAVANLTNAHEGLVQSWLRGVFVINKSMLLVQDDLEGLKDDVDIVWQMITPAEIQINHDGRSAILNQNGKVLEASIISPANAVFMTQAARPEKSIENQNIGFSILTAHAKGDGGNTRVAIVLRPTGKNWPTHYSVPDLYDLKSYK
jgi:hypothetical protein